MPIIKVTITNDFKNSSKSKEYPAEFLVGKYGVTNRNPEPYFRFLIDREDDRRVVITLTADEMHKLLTQITELSK